MLGEPSVHALPGADPGAVIGSLGSVAPEAVVLWGSWFGERRSRSVLVFPSPLERRTGLDAEEAIAALDDVDPAALHSDTGGSAGSTGPLGGGWLLRLGYAAATSSLQFHDHLLRWRPGVGWQLETLGLPGREAAVRFELARWRQLLGAPPPAPGFRVGDFSTRAQPAVARLRHLAGVEEVIGRIDRGECYQLNLCTRLHADFAGDRAAAFAAMADRLDPEFGAFWPGEPTMVSFSPELFLRAGYGQVSTSPVKGTAPRDSDETVDGARATALRQSAKDVAENVMITDLMRNDLSRVSRPGTVGVDRPLELQAHPGVWHLVSTVTGQLTDGTGAADLLRATFPPGSVTGAPKVAAVAAISQLEVESRGVYTGALGLLSPLGGLHLSVVIRTLEVSDGRVSLGVGGGITVDSVPVLEWAECLHKARPLVIAAGSELDPELPGPAVQASAAQLAGGVFETMLADGGNIPRLAGHLARIDRATRELYGAGVPEALAGRLRTQTATSSGRQAVRVTARPVTAGLDWQVTMMPIGPPVTSADLAHRRRSAGSWRHKWIDRDELSAIARVTPDALPYFTDEDDQVSETVRSNIFWLDVEQGWCTPPLTDDVLPGVTRRSAIDILADSGRAVRIAPLPRSRFAHAQGVFLTSSLSGAVEVRTIDGRPVPGCRDVVDVVNRGLTPRQPPHPAAPR